MLSSGFKNGSRCIHLNEVGCCLDVADYWVVGDGWFGVGCLEVEEHWVIDC